MIDDYIWLLNFTYGQTHIRLDTRHHWYPSWHKIQTIKKEAIFEKRKKKKIFPLLRWNCRLRQNSAKQGGSEDGFMYWGKQSRWSFYGYDTMICGFGNWFVLVLDRCTSSSKTLIKHRCQLDKNNSYPSIKRMKVISSFIHEP